LYAQRARRLEGNRNHFILNIEPLKMNLTEGSETSAKLNMTPEKYTKEHIQE
jgi:hypothetical protein